MSKILFFTGIIATLGAFFTGLGEFLMLYSPDGGYGLVEGHQNFLYADWERLKLGFFLGVMSAPFYLIGYWHVSCMLKLDKTKWHWVIIGLALYGFMLGNVWLGSNAYLALLIQSAHASDLPLLETLITQFLALSDPLLQVVRVAVLSLSAILIFNILRGKTSYPRWMVTVSPFLVILYIFALYSWGPVWTHYFLPAALNVAHTVFFAFSTYFAYKLSR